MANCTICGKQIGMLAQNPCGLCVADLNNKHKAELEKRQFQEAELAEQQKQELDKEAAHQEERKAHIEAILVTTETAPNLNIAHRLEIVTAQAAFEINNFKDIIVGFMNPVKGRSSELEKQLDTLKERALYGLKDKAYDLKANAVVAVDIDISTVTIGQISMLMLVASGTAVLIED